MNSVWKDTVSPMENQEHWDEQRRRKRERVEPLVGYVGVGSKLKVTEAADSIIVQPSVSTFVWMAVLATGFVPFAAWVFYQRFRSILGLALVVLVGGLLEFLVIRFVTRQQWARITGDRIVVETMAGGRKSVDYDRSDFEAVYVGHTWYSADGTQVQNNIIWLKSRGGSDVPLVATDRDVGGLVAAMAMRLDLPIRNGAED